MNERILIIEDDQAILKLLQRGLAYEGYTVDTATDGRMGLIAARDHTPDLVILDWMLPGMDGLEVWWVDSNFDVDCEGYCARSHSGTRCRCR